MTRDTIIDINTAVAALLLINTVAIYFRPHNNRLRWVQAVLVVALVVGTVMLRRAPGD